MIFFYFRRSLASKIALLIITNTLFGCAGGGGTSDGGEDASGVILGAALLYGAYYLVRNMDKGSNLGKSNTKQEELNNSKSRFGPIRYNVYDQMKHIGAEPENFGLYTYVLFGKRSVDETGRTKKYEIILSELQSLAYWPAYSKPPVIKSGESIEPSQIDTRDMNIFLIPTKEENGGKIVSIHDYNFDLSLYILREVFSKRTGLKLQRKLSGEGPFLISMPKPIQKSGELYLLYADLSTVSEEIVRDVIETYKDGLSKGNREQLDPFGFAENLRIQFGQQLVNFNQVFEVIGKAYAIE